ncbi:hypothetical protein AXG93_4295s1610 [Marchantia polymorpha subsp. ruderalis]|nr:hypothetical protein AXG93_4295s1610 [Marchantia polymorpha subsp. ruderalis]
MVQQRRGEDERTSEEEQQPQAAASGREFRDSPMEQQHVGRDAPTSQVGYGGGDRTAEYVHYPPAQDAESVVERNDELEEGQAHGGRFVGGHGITDPRLSADQPLSNPQALGLPDYGGNAGRPTESHYSSSDRNVDPPAAKSGHGAYAGEGAAQRSSSEYGTTDANARPSEAGDGVSGPGGYAGEGGSKVTGYGTCDGNAFPSEAGTGVSSEGGYAGEGGAQRSFSSQESPYGSSVPNAKPSEAGTGTSALGGYAGEGGAQRDADRSFPVTHKSQHVQDSSSEFGLPTPMRPPGAPALLDEQHLDGPKYGRDSDSSTAGDEFRPAGLQEDEVRAGVPHGVVSGHPSGAGQENYGAGEVGKVGHQDAQPHEYHQTGSFPSHGGSAYSQEYTQPDAPDTRFSDLQGVDHHQTSSKHSPAETTNMTPTAVDGNTHQEEGFMAKLKSHLPGHKQHHAPMNVDTKPATDPTTPGAEHEKPSFMEKIKDKLSPGHHNKQTTEQKF